MSLLRVAWKNTRRNAGRTATTVLAVAISLVAYVLLQSVSFGYSEQVRQTPNNRVVTRHKLGWAYNMPIHYAAEVRGVKGVVQAMGGRWVGLKVPLHEEFFFESLAVEPAEYVAMHYELAAPARDKAAFVGNRRGALVSEELAQKFGWKIGDSIVLKSRDYPGEFNLIVSAIFHSTRYGYAQRAIFMHWQYLNESLPLRERERIDVISAQVADPSLGARLAKDIDIHFDSQDPQSFSMEDQALIASEVGRYGAILSALDTVSVLILGMVLLILGNTLAMGVRERTREYGMLRAVGFAPRHVMALVLGEAALIGLAGGLVGLALAYPIVQRPLSRYLEEAAGFAPLHVPLSVALSCVLAGAALGVLSASTAARGAAKLDVVQALRRVG
ncbi:MAG TPA: FtsX-like permease family protein [Polyangiaceae bacterium]|nr:FtsX-like permease family protein [Polyangiaceae bacterium]